MVFGCLGRLHSTPNTPPRPHKRHGLTQAHLIQVESADTQNNYPDTHSRGGANFSPATAHYTNAHSAHSELRHTSTSTYNQTCTHQHTSTSGEHKPHSYTNRTHLTCRHTDPTRTDTPTNTDTQQKHKCSHTDNHPASNRSGFYPNSFASNHSGSEGAGHTS